MAARDALARSLRKGGERDEAERVRALRRPSPAAWTINQLARDDDLDAMPELLAAGERLREAQDAALAGRADARDELRAAMGGQRAAIDALLAAARKRKPAGKPLSAAMLGS